MKRTLLIASSCFFLFSSCKKDYTCECTNTNGTYIAGKIKDTKHQAEKYCKDMSGTNTNCYMKE